MASELIDPFDSEYKTPADPEYSGVDSGLVDPFDEPAQEAAAQELQPDVVEQPAQSQGISGEVAKKVDPAAWETLKQSLRPKDSVQSGIEDVVYTTGMGIAGKAAGGYAGAAEYLTGGSYEDFRRCSGRRQNFYNRNC